MPSWSAASTATNSHADRLPRRRCPTTPWRGLIAPRPDAGLRAQDRLVLGEQHSATASRSIQTRSPTYRRSWFQSPSTAVPSGTDVDTTLGVLVHVGVARVGWCSGSRRAGIPRRRRPDRPTGTGARRKPGHRSGVGPTRSDRHRPNAARSRLTARWIASGVVRHLGGAVDRQQPIDVLARAVAADRLDSRQRPTRPPQSRRGLPEPFRSQGCPCQYQSHWGQASDPFAEIRDACGALIVVVGIGSPI